MLTVAEHDGMLFWGDEICQDRRERKAKDDVLNLMTMDEFIGINQQATETVCMDITDKPAVRVTDEQAKELIRKISKCENVSDFQHLDTVQRNKYLKKLREKGLSIRQLSRLTGVSVNIVRNV